MSNAKEIERLRERASFLEENPGMDDDAVDNMNLTVMSCIGIVPLKVAHAHLKRCPSCEKGYKSLQALPMY